MPIKVVIVDDSALIRSVLKKIIEQTSDIQVVGVAPDPLIAREVIRATNPDVITLDVEMPKMDGLEFLEKLMRLRPMPVLMISTLTEKGSDVTLRALELGAIDFVSKPKIDIEGGMHEYAEEITTKIRMVAKARVRQLTSAVAASKSADAVPSHADPVNRHRPSVDVLYRSAANIAGKNAIGVILTGMGKDGAAGMKEMHEAGAHTFAQDEASCVVFGMPKEAIAQGGVDDIVPLKDMAKQVLAYLSTLGGKAFCV